MSTNEQWYILKGKIFELERTKHHIEQQRSMSMSAYIKPEGIPSEGWVAPPMDEHTKGYFGGLSIIEMFVDQQLSFLNKLITQNPPPPEMVASMDEEKDTMELIHAKVSSLIYSKRKKYFKIIKKRVETRMGTNQSLAWPDVFLRVTVQDAHVAYTEASQ